MKIKIDEKMKTPIYLQIASQLKELIVSGEMEPGMILPSERVMASVLGVHRNTINKAYSELKAEGFIEASQGIASRVLCKNQGEGQRDKPKPKKVNWQNLIKEEYMDMEKTFDDLFQRFGEENIISLGGGISSPDIYNKKEIAKGLGEIIAQEGKTQYFYSPYQGDKNLIMRLISFLSVKGIHATTGEIQIMSETNQAIDFIITLLVKPGDVIILEEPVSPDVYRTMELAGGKIITVPVDEDGMICENLEPIIEANKPKLIYVNSSFHDPTGGILSLERRKKIIELSNKYRIPIVEEDAASELVYLGPKMPTLKSLDTMGNVIYIYSFSLTFTSGLSMAFVVGPKELIQSLSYLVSVRLVAIDWVTQKLLALYLGDGSYYKKLETFRQDYDEKRKLVCRYLDYLSDLGVSYEMPRGGVYVWAKLPQGLDSKEFLDRAYKNGVAILPGHVFYPFKNGGRDHIRINYSYEPIERIEEGMRRIEKTILEML